MSKSSKYLLQGVVLVVVGLVLRFLMGDLNVPVVDLTHIGNLLMIVGGVTLAMGLFELVRGLNAAKSG